MFALRRSRIEGQSHLIHQSLLAARQCITSCAAVMSKAVTELVQERRKNHPVYPVGEPLLSRPPRQSDAVLLYFLRKYCTLTGTSEANKLAMCERGLCSRVGSDLGSTFLSYRFNS